jgi:uridine kinase
MQYLCDSIFERSDMKPLVIGICGGSGSGKTSLIRNLRASFAPEEVCIISQDDYYRPLHEQALDERGIHNFDLPQGVDRKALRRDLKKLIAGNAVERMEYTFNNKEAVPNLQVFLPAPVLVVEGLFVFHLKKIRALFDLRIFVYTKDNLTLIRRIRRDRAERNYPVDDVLYRFEHHILPAYERYILPYKDAADLVINNNQQFDQALLVLQGFIKQHLQDSKP